MKKVGHIAQSDMLEINTKFYPEVTEEPTWEYLRFEILTAVNLSVVVFWVVTPRGPVSGYQLLEKNVSYPSSI